jgi:hypothetical protein
MIRITLEDWFAIAVTSRFEGGDFLGAKTLAKSRRALGLAVSLIANSVSSIAPT